MDLLAYIQLTGRTYRDLAECSGVPFPVLNAIAHGSKGWSPEVGLAIVRAAEGKVTLEAMAETRKAWLERHGRARRQPESAA